jgi:hypothetical protein
VSGRSGYLLLRRGGGIWGIANDQVTSLGREERGGDDHSRSAGAAYRVGTDAAPLAADEILGVAADLAVFPPARAVARWWPAGSNGCAVWGGLPVVMVDARRPPLALRMVGEPATEPAGETGGEPNDGD